MKYDVVFKSGDQAPGLTSGITFSSFTGVSVNNHGYRMVSGTVAGTGVTTSNDTGLWIENASGWHLVAREGDETPTPGVRLGNMARQFSLSDSGHVADQIGLTGTGVTTANDIGLLRFGIGEMHMVGREGTQVPGLPNGTLWGNLNATLTRDGKLVVTDSLSGTGVTTSNNEIRLWWDNGSLTKIAREGDPIPNTTSAVFGSSILGSDVSPNGQVVFGVNTSGLIAPGQSASPAFFTWSPTNPVPVLAIDGDTTGSLVPGLSGVRHSLSVGVSPLINDAGEIAFISSLTGTGVNSGNNRSLWYGLPGAQENVFREGGAVPNLAPGTVWWEQSAEAFNINNAGEIVFRGEALGTTRDFVVMYGQPGAYDLVAREDTQAPGLAAGRIFDQFQRFHLSDTGGLFFNANVTGTGVNSLNDDGVWAWGPDDVLTKVIYETDSFTVAPGDVRTISAFLPRPNNRDQKLVDDAVLPLHVWFDNNTTQAVILASLDLVEDELPPDPAPVPLPAVLSLFCLGLWRCRSR